MPTVSQHAIDQYKKRAEKEISNKTAKDLILSYWCSGSSCELNNAYRAAKYGDLQKCTQYRKYRSWILVSVSDRIVTVYNQKPRLPRYDSKSTKRRLEERKRRLKEKFLLEEIKEYIHGY